MPIIILPTTPITIVAQGASETPIRIRTPFKARLPKIEQPKPVHNFKPLLKPYFNVILDL